jgi:DNA-binding Lrp family transcriptional regulator
MKRTREYYESLREFVVSKVDNRNLEALLKTSPINGRQAARDLGLSEGAVNRTVKTLESRAAKRGCIMNESGQIDVVPPGFSITRMTTTVSDPVTGDKQWVQVTPDKEENNNSLKSFFRDEFPELVKNLHKPEQLVNYGFTTEDVMSIYPIGDLHLGLFTEPECYPDQEVEEGKEKYGTTDAEEIMATAVELLVEMAPHTDIGMLINLGDFFHCDNQENVTRKSRNKLQVDGEWGKNFKIGVQLAIRLVNKMLTKHKQVLVYNLIGNHDEQTSYALAIALDCFYESDDRVIVNTDFSPFKYYEFGQNLIGMAHGDGIKMDKLDSVMASDVPQMWGRTTKRKWYTGHIHHQSLKEYPGCVVESFRSLAPKDNWHYKSGYRAGRDAVVIALDKDYGEVSRYTVNIDKIKAMMNRHDA